MSRRKRVRYTLDIQFECEAERDGFKKRMSDARAILSGSSHGSLDNFDFLSAMLDLVEGASPPAASSPGNQRQTSQSFMRNSGVFSGNQHPGDEAMFLVERHCFSDLIEGVASPCPCGMTRKAWMLESATQKGHVLRALFSCRRCHQHKRTWSSSRVFGGRYLANQKLVHAFTCSGMLPTQYIKFSDFAGIGTVKHGYISKVYKHCSYIEIVAGQAEKSMQAAVDEVKALSEYSTNGEWVVTDARHDSTANAYHTTVPCLSGSTHRILGISTLSRVDHSTAQTREYECTKVVLPQVVARGLNVVEVAHDIQQQVSGYVQKMGFINSFDTWHGTKNVGKEMKKVAQGRVRDREKTWFSQLSDKPKSIKLHLYWAMKNCGNDPEILQNMIDNIVNHYIGDHTGCHSTSPCQTPNYTPSKIPLKSPRAATFLMKSLRDTYIYRYASSFCRCRDTFFVESFNHQLLCYVPKRIHFSSTVFIMRLNLAVLDWNENVDRPYTSIRKVKDLRRPDRRTSMKALVAKKFTFVASLWEEYVNRNKVDLMPVDDDDDLGDGVGSGEDNIEDGAFCFTSDEESDDGDDDDDDDDNGLNQHESEKNMEEFYMEPECEIEPECETEPACGSEFESCELDCGSSWLA